ncbi:MAG TPA: hypothetical protein VN132_13565, partial [Bdellovibrio sp.]|nr:hypothetical protein [Bdellovibrio sp.]
LLFLGMIYEEQGQLHHALTTYENAAQVDSIEFTTKIRAQAQLLRLKTFLGLKLGLSELYHICLKAKTNLRGLNVELEHSLMLAEIVLFGPLMAKERIHKVLKSYQPNLYEIRLLVFDYAEEVLRQGLCVDDMCSLMKSIPFEQLDEFEKVIFTIITEPNLNLDPKDLQKISEKVPLMGLLRILILNIKSSKNKLLVTECRRKFLFHLEALNTESKAILLKKWERDLGQEHQILKYDGQLCRISLESHNFLVKKNSFMDKCFYLFRNQSVMSLEDFVQNVFEVQHDLNSYDRVRMALSRVNKELSSFTGVPKIFILSKTQVELNSSFIIAEND